MKATFECSVFFVQMRREKWRLFIWSAQTRLRLGKAATRRRTPNLIAPACSNLNNMACFHIYCNLAGLPLTIDFGENSSLFIRG